MADSQRVEEQRSRAPAASANVPTTLTYTGAFTPGEDGLVTAQVLEVPEAISQGRTIDEAKANYRRRWRPRLSGEPRRARGFRASTR